ncbi:hypothetical protein BBBOND_0109080 [Babesia bigemina]|uniref:Uncharacterized protein n=1 Tax=Babesia bigemina TaxID=5866 RepID=A0A061DA35_BABBI|nr:hypothetical protein BBBOND_0109080 [Babesia bigemina]CDR94610.1 hypothetical protein BBBOND_0109080 [Babesia bigemina]|eukprot:XP_012766796.1 hypothetical protein BBBOND_0109080 [Babesia bigemina]
MDAKTTRSAMGIGQAMDLVTGVLAACKVGLEVPGLRAEQSIKVILDATTVELGKLGRSNMPLTDDKAPLSGGDGSSWMN